MTLSKLEKLQVLALTYFCFHFQDGDQWYIIIEPKEKKKSSFLGVFGSGDSGKKVHLYTRDSAKHLSHTIEDIRTSQQP